MLLQSRARPADGLVVDVHHFICRDEEERAWMLDMHRRIGPYARRANAALGALIALCLPWFDLWSVVPIVAAAVVFVAGGVLVDHRDRVEPLVAAWFVAQALIAVAIAVNGRQHLGDLAILVFAGVGASGGFPSRLVVVCTAYTALLMIGLGLGFDGGVVIDDPPRLIVPLAVLIAVQILATAVRRASIEHRAASIVDPLTGMFNRAALTARAAELEHQSLSNEQPVSVVVADLDHFKQVNDTHGHARGDAVLTDVASLMREQLRGYDSAYRLGGEEFLVLAPGLDAPQAAGLAERLRAAVGGEPIAGLTVTASFGVATSSAEGRFDLRLAMSVADSALYVAKHAGRDRVVSLSAPVQTVT